MDIAKIAEDSIRLQYRRSRNRIFKTEEERRRELAAAGRSGAEDQTVQTIQYGKGKRLPSSKSAAMIRLASLLGG